MSGGAILLAGHMLKTWSPTQSNIALSVANFEIYATMKICQESLGMTANSVMR